MAMKPGWRLVLLASLLFTGAGNRAASAAPPAAPAPGTLRCGWFENPTPANAWLTDRHGEWTIGVQGGHQAEGDWPRFAPYRWVRTNGNYGYGCACIRWEAAANDFLVSKIISSTSRPLAVCRKDRALKEPKADTSLPR